MSIRISYGDVELRGPTTAAIRVACEIFAAGPTKKPTRRAPPPAEAPRVPAIPIAIAPRAPAAATSAAAWVSQAREQITRGDTAGALRALEAAIQELW